MIKKALKILLALLLVAILYLLFWPVDFEPVSFTPPPDPGLKGDFAPNDKLKSAEHLLKGVGIGPEAVAIGPDSMLYSGYEDGRIVKYSKDGKDHEIFANTEGRPLGMTFDQNKNLIVADEMKGLLSIDSTGKVSLLADEADGKKIFFADDLDITAEGIIYFTDASQRNHDVEREIWELQPTGRLLSYNLATKETKLELDNMRFANGVALGPDDEYVMITETFGTVIHKLWLKGPKKGQKEVWVNELPGFPDNITYNGNGIFWVAIPNIRIGEHFEVLYDKPFLRKVVSKLPKSITGAKEPPPYGFVIGFDMEGNVKYNFQDTKGSVYYITSVIEIDKALYLGSLKMESLGKYDIENIE